MKICVLIPSYNEAKTIGSLVKNLKGKGLDTIVVDDGSFDRTAEVAQQAGAYVLRQEQNKGKGASLKQGFDYILTQDYQAVITMDGDGQHSPEDIYKFIEQANNPDLDIVAGNRMSQSKNMPPVRWITNKLMSFLISKICRHTIRDSQCGFRLIKTRVLKKINLSSSNYEIESELAIKASRKGCTIKSVPIQTIYAKQVSQINPIIDTLRFFRFILKLYLPFQPKKR